MKKHNKSIHLSTLTIIAISVTVIAAVAICMFMFAKVYDKTLLKNTSVSSEQSVQQTTIAVDNYLDEMKQKLAQISKEIAKADSTEDIDKKISIITGLQNDIYSVMIYDSNGKLLSCGTENGKIKDNIERNLSFDRELFENADGFAVSSPHVQNLFQEEYPWVVTIAVKEKNALFGGDVYIAIDFKFSEIAKYIDNVGIGTHGYCYIIDKNGNVVYHPQQQLLFSGLKEEDVEKVSSFSDGVHNQGNTIYTLNTASDGNWRIVGMSFIDDLATERNTQILRGVLISFFCCAVLALLTLIVFSKIVTAPVGRLVKAMKNFEKSPDSFQYEANDESVAEIKVLSDSFEHMSKMTKQLMERVRKEEITLRKTELKALQAQINPHFLYNTLDSIQWMCEQGKNEDAVEMVGALAKLFRISISRGKELIPIKDEMRHAESYLIIQSYRYKNQFTYEFFVDEDLEDCFCNKITVQPLIENAIYHGIDRMVDEGKITIRVKKADDNDILIEIEDNGVGMSEEQCKRILEKEHSDSSGIGVKNVNDRLKIYFGEKYGISIKSELDEGTVVTVRIPQIRKENENEIQV